MHRGSRENLLGKEADEALARNLSNELQVTAETPPTFIFQTDADTAVPAENCVAFYLALRRAGVPAEIAHLPGREAWRRTGTGCAGHVDLARPAARLAAHSRITCRPTRELNRRSPIPQSLAPSPATTKSAALAHPCTVGG